MNDYKIEEIKDSKYFRIPLDLLDPNPFQKRRFFDKRALESLAESIKKIGQLEDILVRPMGEKFQIVLGERRWKACQLGGLPTINAKVRELTNDDTLLISLAENIQRENLTDVEEAFAFKSYLDKGMSQKDVGIILGKMDERVGKKLKLLSSSYYTRYLEHQLAQSEEDMEKLRQENRVLRSLISKGSDAGNRE